MISILSFLMDSLRKGTVLLTLIVLMYCRPAASSVHYTTSCKHSLALPRMGEIIARNRLKLIEIINKPLLSHLVGYLYYWQMGFNSVFKGLKTRKNKAKGGKPGDPVVGKPLCTVLVWAWLIACFFIHL